MMARVVKGGVGVLRQCQVQQRAPLHLSSPRPALPAIPPALFLLAKPLARVATVILGKYARRRWRQLPGGRRAWLQGLAARHKGKVAVVGVAAVAGVWQGYTSHVQECPVTGRTRFVALTPEQVKKISRNEFEQLLEELEGEVLDHTHPLYTRVTRVANRLLQGNKDLRQIYDKQWTVTVVDNPTRNAFVLPSGNIFMYRGMLDLCKNDDMLAVILGHEMAHAVLGHTAERLTNASFLNLVLLLPFALLWALLPNDGVALVANWFFDKVVEVAVELPFSRAMEAEADEVGLVMAAKACFDVREAPPLWGLMELLAEDETENDTDLEFLSTHPVHSTRQESLATQLAAALSLRLERGCSRLECQDPNLRLEEFREYLRAAARPTKHQARLLEQQAGATEEQRTLEIRRAAERNIAKLEERAGTKGQLLRMDFAQDQRTSDEPPDASTEASNDKNASPDASEEESGADSEASTEAPTADAANALQPMRQPA